MAKDYGAMSDFEHEVISSWESAGSAPAMVDFSDRLVASFARERRSGLSSRVGGSELLFVGAAIGVAASLEHLEMTGFDFGDLAHDLFPAGAEAREDVAALEAGAVELAADSAAFETALAQDEIVDDVFSWA